MRRLISALTLAAALSGTAFAHGMPPGAGAGPMMNQQMMMGPMMGSGPMMMGPGPMMMGAGAGPMMMDPTRHVEGRLAYLKAELKITDAQAPQWTAFVDAFRRNAQHMGELHKTMMGHGPMMGQTPGQAAMPALPEQLEFMEKAMTAHLDMVRAMKAPTLALYAVLSDEQKREANALLHGPMGMM